MDQSKSSDKLGAPCSENKPPVIAPRSFSVEFFVGLFTMAGVAACGYLAIGLGDFRFSNASTYTIYAEFDNISGLKSGASVEIAGVPIGDVAGIELKDPAARIELRINRSVLLRDDDIASIRTKGIIGDRYVKISRGGSTTTIPEGGTLTETESVVDIEDVIGKIVHSLSSKEDEGETKDATAAAQD